MTNCERTPQPTAEKIREAAKAMERFAEVLKSGPQYGMRRVGPGLAGIRLVTL